MRNFLVKKIQLYFSVIFAAFMFSIPLYATANPVIPIPTLPQTPNFTPSAPNIDATSYILLDASSNKIIAETDSDKRVPPASLTKLMSLYIISAAIKNGSVKLDDKVRISTEAWKAEGSRMFVKANDWVPVNELLQGIIVASGNDATVALAEYVAGSEEAFVSMMNQEAEILGMKNTHFMDSTGLPNPEHYSTAHDLAILTQAYIKNFPEDYAYYSEKWFTYGGIKQPNRNRLLWRYQYADGLKTGHTAEAGYCLVGSAKKDGMRLISVVLGAPSDAARTEDSIRLLTYGFRFFETRKLYDAGTPVVQARIWKGQKAEIPLGFNDDFYVTIPTGQYKKVQTEVVLNNPLQAPITKGQVYGTLKINLGDQTLAEKPLIALESNEAGGFFRRATDAIKMRLNKYFTRSDDKVNTS